ncbi:MAG: PEP-CTERM sorting domain-containing protein [Lacunisphaera sp.]|nr:PEP-CTERM sorting domain-containing protein [Lacunisphaera sp.]
MYSRPRRLFLAMASAALLGMSTVASASAQTVFTITATADSTGVGYTATQAYTFVITSGASFASNGNDYFNSSESFWAEYDTGDDQLVTSLGGTGLSGTYTRPTAIWNELDVHSSYMTLRTGPDDFDGAFGVTRLDTADLHSFYTRIDSGISFTPSATYVEPFGPSGYFSNYTGSYSAGGYVDLRDTAGTHTYFTITNLSISAAAIPEPSTYAALAGLAGLGLAMLRRRRAA